jgi:hypothetical protein
MGRPRQIQWWLERIVAPRIETLSGNMSLSIRTPNRIGYTWIWLADSRDR